jgi:hypothetical protein
VVPQDRTDDAVQELPRTVAEGVVDEDVDLIVHGGADSEHMFPFGNRPPREGFKVVGRAVDGRRERTGSS